MVWVINYPHYVSFKLLPGLPIPDPKTIVINWSKVRPLKMLKGYP